MENTIILIPSPAQFVLHFRREPEVVLRPAKQRVLVREVTSLRKVERSTQLVGINRQTERIYGMANLVAVFVMATALMAAFGICLTSFVAQ
jgi:hypothetical protein